MRCWSNGTRETDYRPTSSPKSQHSREQLEKGEKKIIVFHLRTWKVKFSVLSTSPLMLHSISIFPRRVSLPSFTFSPPRYIYIYCKTAHTLCCLWSSCWTGAEEEAKKIKEKEEKVLDKVYSRTVDILASEREREARKLVPGSGDNRTGFQPLIRGPGSLAQKKNRGECANWIRWLDCATQHIVESA